MTAPERVSGAAIEARGITKGFFGNPVLRDVSLALLPGRVHALLGENGAGKSTLINILSGALTPDSGTIALPGSNRPGLTPRAARAARIAVVAQELSLAPHLSIAENVGLGAMPTRFGLVDTATLARRAATACTEIGLTEPLATRTDRLPLGRRQMLEIAKALFRRPRVLILDEPSSSLSAHEFGLLRAMVERQRAAGVAILYISHRLDEVRALCEHVTVLKDGAVTADRPLAGVSAEALVGLMVGRAHDAFPAFRSSALGAVALTVSGFASGACTDVSLTLHEGEVVGLGGLVGHGQEDVLRGLVGAQPGTAAGPPRLPSNPGEAARNGIVYVPADRKRETLLLPHAIGLNLLLPSFARLAGRWRRRPRERTQATTLARAFDVRGDLERPVEALSGGNQQKVALARSMPLRPRVLLLNDPTRGVDVATKRQIYDLVQTMAAEGRAILLLSSDTPELARLCDRVLVMREGRLVATLSHAAATEAAIVGAAMGVAAAA